MVVASLLPTRPVLRGFERAGASTAVQPGRWPLNRQLSYLPHSPSFWVRSARLRRPTFTSSHPGARQHSPMIRAGRRACSLPPPPPWRGSATLTCASAFRDGEPGWSMLQPQRGLQGARAEPRGRHYDGGSARQCERHQERQLELHRWPHGATAVACPGSAGVPKHRLDGKHH
jgi:hypothetical protein